MASIRLKFDRLQATKHFLYCALLVLASFSAPSCLGQEASRGADNGAAPVVGATESPVAAATTTLSPLAGAPDRAPEPELSSFSESNGGSTRTTVKKKLAPTTSTEAPQPRADTSEQQAPAAAASPLGALIPQGSVGGRAGELASLSPELAKSIGETLARLPGGAFSREQAAPGENETASIDSLLPKSTSLFQQDAIDPTQLGQMDCHLRNIDYCVAGLLGTAQKMLPESDAELEARCDEMKVTTSCMAIYNKRCSTFKVFSLLAPFSQDPQEFRRSSLLTEPQRQAIASAVDTISVPTELLPSSGKKASQQNSKITLANLMELCTPGAERTSPASVELRQRVYALARCINSRVPKLTPCLDDLKAAAQVFYEAQRVLPMRPTCCALARFRSCSMAAIDNVCGLSSFEQLVQSLSGGGGGGFGGGGGGSMGPLSMLKTIDRVCRQAADFRSSYCREVLPPSGMKAPLRRGNKASKLAKALDLISFAPATQELGL